MKKLVRKITLEKKESKLVAGKIFIEATLIQRTNNSDTSTKEEFIYRNHMHIYCPLSKGKIRIIFAIDYKDDCKLKKNIRCGIEQREFCRVTPIAPCPFSFRRLSLKGR